MTTDGVLSDRIATVRAFNRFYTNLIGVLRGRYLGTDYSVTEARVIYELAQSETTDVPDLRQVLDLDAGYLSRVLAKLEADDVVRRERSATDARRGVVRLTERGAAAFATLNARSTAELGQMLAGLQEEEQRRLVAAMGVILEVLEGAPRPSAFVLRAPEPGDLGWVVQRHGALYAQEYGWNDTFEALVARIVADYVDHRDPKRESAWVAEVDGEPVGSVFCVRRDADTAQLRLLLVDPKARGMGVGRRLVEECMRFARRVGYKRLMLWTNDVLTDARRIYDRAGFQLVEEEPHHSFGHDLVGQILALDL